MKTWLSTVHQEEPRLLPVYMVHLQRTHKWKQGMAQSVSSPIMTQEVSRRRDSPRTWRLIFPKILPMTEVMLFKTGKGKVVLVPF